MPSRFILPFADVGSGILPSSGSKLYFYSAGTTTPKDTHTTKAATTANSNPLVSDSKGVFPDIFITGSYKVILKDKNNVQKWEADPVDELSVGDADTNLINDLSQTYTFATVAAFKASLIVFPDGKIIHLNDRAADFTKITGNAPTNDAVIIFSDDVSQSIEYTPADVVSLRACGVSTSETSINAQEAAVLAQSLQVPLNNDVPDADFSGILVVSNLLFNGMRNVIKPTLDQDIITASGASTELHVSGFKSNQSAVSAISSMTKAIGANGCSVVSIENSRCINGAQGWFVENTNAVRLHKNTQRAMAQFPLYVLGFDDCEITNNLSKNNTGFDGIKVASYTDNSGEAVVQARRLIITGNISYENSSDGIDCAVAGSEQTVISNNICTNNGLKEIDLKITDNALGNLPYNNVAIFGNTLVSNVASSQGISCQGAEDLTRDLDGWNIYNNTIRMTGAGSTGVRITRAKDFNIHTNDIQAVIYGVRVSSKNDGHKIHHNNLSKCTTGVRFDITEIGSPDNNKVYSNDISPLTRAVDIDAGDNNQVYDNDWTVPNAQYSVRYEANGSSATNSVIGRNKKGTSLALPTGDRVIPGEYYDVSPPTVGYPIRWVAHTQDASAGSAEITNDGQLGHRDVIVNPNGNTATLFIGEEILDTVSRIWYKSTTTGSNNWKALNA